MVYRFVAKEPVSVKSNTKFTQGRLETDQFVQEALDAMLANIAILDGSGAIIAVNAAWREFADDISFDHADSGIGFQYLAFCNSTGMYRPTHALQVARGVSEVISGKRDSFQFEYPCNIFKDQYWYLLSANRFRSHGETRIMIVHQDITELKHAKKQHSEGRQEIASILDLISSGVFTVTAAGAIESCNLAAEHIFGYPRDQLSGMQVAELVGYPGCDGSGLRKANGGHVLHMRGKRSDGSEFPMYVYVRQVKIEEWFRYTIVVEDMDDSKRLEKEPLHLSSRKDLELREMKSRFLAMMSHELRTPLASIRLSHDMLANYGAQSTNAERRFYLDNIRIQVEHLSDILDDVIYLTASQNEDQAFCPESGDLITFCRDVVEAYQLNYHHSHTTSFTCAEREIVARFDKRLLRRALSNLLDNAIKYSPKGGTVELTLRKKPNRALIRVSDRGIGVPPQDANSLFDTFHRASNVGALPGTGLGLAIARQAVEQHEGRIYLLPTNGQGTTFCIELPLERAAESKRE